MENATYRNISFATASGLRDLLAHGAVLRVRGQEIRELRNRLTVLENPRERCLFLPYRNNNIFACVAETFWVLTGRNDVAWLQYYLPRVSEFSDDGLTWSGAYGPRLRNWNGIDQIDAVRTLLLNERLTRRAVMTLYDPGRDFMESKDIPCNNWLHWMVRGELLHMNIAVRSNDAVWGFSGVNAFEWSVLHEMMGFWIGAPVGEATYLASSFHLYQRHYNMAARLVSGFRGVSCYDFGVRPPPFETSWEGFGDALEVWFASEQEIRHDPDLAVEGSRAIADPLMNGTLQLLRVYWGFAYGWPVPRLRDELAALPETDLTAAAYEFFGRRFPEILDDIPHSGIAAFFTAYRQAFQGVSETSSPMVIKPLIKMLHKRKDAAYSDAWKRRGELTSILANIARKVDRLGSYCSNGTALRDESNLDTAVDLFVYVTKYRLFLMDLIPGSAELFLPFDAPRPFSDHISNFDALVDQIQVPNAPSVDREKLVHLIETTFEALHREASTPGSEPGTRLERAMRLSELALLLITTIAQNQPRTLDEFRSIEMVSGQHPKSFPCQSMNSAANGCA